MEFWYASQALYANIGAGYASHQLYMQTLELGIRISHGDINLTEVRLSVTPSINPRTTTGGTASPTSALPNY